MPETQVSRNITTWGEHTVILARVEGKLVRFQFPDYKAAWKAYRKMRKAGADYLHTSEDGETFRWVSAKVIR